LKLNKLFPACVSGNILVTTRNQELRHYAAQDENITSMDHEDATSLLLRLSRAEERHENKELAAQIVQIFSIVFVWGLLSI